MGGLQLQVPNKIYSIYITERNTWIVLKLYGYTPRLLEYLFTIYFICTSILYRLILIIYMNTFCKIFILKLHILKIYIRVVINDGVGYTMIIHNNEQSLFVNWT